MKLECTRKLLDWMGIKAEKQDPVPDPLFAWTANLITVNRRKMLVAANLSSRCRFVLYGLTTKHVRYLPELILEGIRTLLQSEHVRPEIIEQYLKDCGEIVTFAANSSRTAAAAGTRACEWVRSFSNMLAPDDMFQRQLLPWINDEIISKENFGYADELFISRMKEKYGADLQSCRGAELEVELELHTPCRRRLIVPDDLNFYQLHRILQNAFAWKDQHLHWFVTDRDPEGRPLGVIGLEDPALDGLSGIHYSNSLETQLRTVFAEGKTVEYEYDFGDGWNHRIKLVRFLPDCATPYPRCTELTGDAPMEGCGGPEGFAEIQAILRDPGHPEYRAVCAWVQNTWWKPADLKTINTRLRREHRICRPIFWG